MNIRTPKHKPYLRPSLASIHREFTRRVCVVPGSAQPKQDPILTFGYPDRFGVGRRESEAAAEVVAAEMGLERDGTGWKRVLREPLVRVKNDAGVMIGHGGGRVAEKSRGGQISPMVTEARRIMSQPDYQQRPILLDLFCCAGGAGMGYFRAGFRVVGVDINPQKRYPFEFVQADLTEGIPWRSLAALGVTPGNVAAVHASPPCEQFSRITPPVYRSRHADLIDFSRQLIAVMDKPYVIENVEGARHLLKNPIMLCGSMFGLTVWRHRYFEVSPAVYFAPASCRHDFQPVVVNNSSVQKRATKAEAGVAMSIDWMHTDELRKAIPPAYTMWLGHQLMRAMKPRQQAESAGESVSGGKRAFASGRVVAGEIVVKPAQV